MRDRVVCDTNILISALVFPGGRPDEILKLARIGEIDLYISPFIVDEFERVLREKFQYINNEVKQRSERITSISTLIEPSERITVIDEDESDNRILECAVAAKVAFIISGDKHLLAIKELGSIKVVSASEFLKIHIK